jgi:hypothetical protein
MTGPQVSAWYGTARNCTTRPRSAPATGTRNKPSALEIDPGAHDIHDRQEVVVVAELECLRSCVGRPGSKVRRVGKQRVAPAQDRCPAVAIRHRYCVHLLRYGGDRIEFEALGRDRRAHSRGAQPARNVGKAAAAAREPLATSKERRLSCRAAISAKFGSVLMLGAGCAHALSHLRWQVTALRLPCVRPSIGRGLGIGTW